MPLHAGEHRAVGPQRAGTCRGGPDRRRIRLYGLAGIVVCAVVLPFAVASAGPPGDGTDGEPAVTVPLLARGGDGKASAVPATEGPPPSVRRCRPARRLPRAAAPNSPPAGVEAQTCVLARGAETWARTYYRNATGGPLESVLSLMGPNGRSVRMRCAVGAEDEPGSCETPPESTGGAGRGGLAGYSAVAEFARLAGYGPLLLRAGSGAEGESNHPAGTGS